MTWDYRLCRYTIDGDTLFAIREVFYDEAGHVSGHTRAAVDDWETVEEVAGTLRMMLTACERPVLDVDLTPDEDEAPELTAVDVTRLVRIDDGPDALTAFMHAEAQRRAKAEDK